MGTKGFYDRLRAFGRGERTWAEVEGITWEDAKGFSQMGADLAAAGRLEEARVIFEGLVALNQRDAASRAALGAVFERLGREGEALEAYSAALDLDADNVVALANRGELRLKTGDRLGRADLSRAVACDPFGETAPGRRAGLLVKALASF